MKIIIDSKKRKTENILKKYPGAVIIDVTSNGTDEFSKLSPFYPIGEIPVPGMELKALCVEGIWQGLKVFEHYDWDEYYFRISTKNIKRTVRKFGHVKGHFYEGELLGYVEARKKIYLPAYQYVLENKMTELIEKLREIAKHKTLVLLDYTTNESILNPAKPLSHAAVIKAAILMDYSILEKNSAIKNESTQGTLF
jgi:hypothetical protein